ncbi:death-associated inhibitor of apoptosis 1-like [Aphis craccivora]|uniref:Death-associated inhibitor of apoptosis 1-like n=1 Tax=Aphis craccivora TaxID=307492 RepID=A0A6G0WH82_APHCR|nr:death-associated inhibitor of apoptosis 1-like [Aphis craccivora]
MNLQKTSNDISSLVSLVRSKSFPTYPEYIIFTFRLKTFIYRGVKDVVECFSCGLVLHYWKKDDTPWIEHSRHNPECIYVLLSKGNHFVEYVKTKCGRTKCNCEIESYDTTC